ncbi:MAG: hypothetical protein CR994_09440 [Maribacter sp.]|nr:MAG: hypothetical protein CR994_09440 [Maribacter sp.]
MECKTTGKASRSQKNQQPRPKDTGYTCEKPFFISARALGKNTHIPNGRIHNGGNILYTVAILLKTLLFPLPRAT